MRAGPRSLRPGGGAAHEDDLVLPFQVEALDVRGRVVRLGDVVDRIVGGHGYPAPVARLLAEAVALTVLLGTALKFEGRFQLQARGKGIVDLLVVDLETPNGVRGFARFDAEALAGVAPGAELLGDGHLAFTVEQRAGANRYQGIVALTGQGLVEAAHHYFAQSEQIPTALRLSAAELIEPGGRSRWRAAGLMAQFLPASPERARVADLDPGDAPAGTKPHVIEEDDAWVEARSLVATIEAHEMIDPDLPPEGLLFRLFHQRGVRVFEPIAIEDRCRCSRERIVGMLRQFRADEIVEMRDPDGGLKVTCEFCGRVYPFDAREVAELETAAERRA